MASDHFNRRNSSAPQSIPLQDLSRPPDPGEADNHGSIHRGSVSRRIFSGRVNTPRQYERVSDDSPTATDRNTLDLPHVTTPRNAHQPPSIYENGEMSPLTQSAFQGALGSVGLVGLSLEAPAPPRPPLSSGPSGRGRSRSILGIITEAGGGDLTPSTPPTMLLNDEGEGYFTPADNDRTPLTDQRFLEPISGAFESTPSAQRHDRLSMQSVRFNEGALPGSRLGDDLHYLENGSRATNRLSRSSVRSAASTYLSPSTAASPLSRAGTIVRKMSQRVVNLSNEPEIIEQSIRRQASLNQATLEGPPSFPAIYEYAHDEPILTPSPIEKVAPLISAGKPQHKWQQPENPLKGKTLCLFPPDNWFRLQLCEMLVHPATEPFILLLIFIQTILLAIENAKPLQQGERKGAWTNSKMNFAFLLLFVIYTLEIVARTIVSGFIKNATEYSSLDKGVSSKSALIRKFRNLFAPQRELSTPKSTTPAKVDPEHPSIIRSFTGMQPQSDQPGHSRQQQRVRLARRAFMRHSFNRLDFLAVISYWISFGFSLSQMDSHQHVWVFEMLSCLRILRLLNLTMGTSVILRSLKKAAPLLVHVAFLIGFFWLLFAIIGVQSFKASLRRTCVWTDLDGSTYTQNSAPSNVQFCGGYLNNSTAGERMPWLNSSGGSLPSKSPKGYLCPRGSKCIEGSNPYNGTVSFDNVPQALQMVFVIMSANTFSDLLYYTTESDYLAAALFFAFGIVIMTFWLMNLLVAVITSSFQVIREESKLSAFTIDQQPILVDEMEEPKRVGPLKRAYDKTTWLWIIIIVFSLLVQCLRSTEMSPSREAFITDSEIVVTVILVVEIVLRFVVDWRNFHKDKRNWVDLGLATVTVVIQIPLIRKSGQPYAWLTFFQIIRIYRVVLAVPMTRELIMTVFGNITGLLNLIVFVFLLTFLAAIFAVQNFRGEFPKVDSQGAYIRITFNDIYNSFIGMYQVLSSENWTILMYNATQYKHSQRTSWIAAIFFILWFILANFIVLNMFIAVIQESFDVTEDEKRLEQVKAFLQRKELGGSSHGNLSLSTIFKLGMSFQRHRDPLDYGPATTDMLLKDAVVREFLDEQLESHEITHTNSTVASGGRAGQVRSGVLSLLWNKAVSILQNREPNPFHSRLQFSRAYKDLDPRTMASEVVSATDQKKRAQREYLQKHPRYNVSLFLFSPAHPVRRFCQRIVGPGRGSTRIEGVDPIRSVWYSFSAFIYAAIVAMVVLACVTNPLYQRAYFERPGGEHVRHWFVWTDMGFAAVFTIEAVIKAIADGFFWTPNACFRSSWGFIDGLVLVTLWISVVTSVFYDVGVSRAVGAFKALRALRLLNVSDSARDTFHSVIILGGWKVLSAAFVSLSLLVPFAIYGLNLFNGQMLQCNDPSNSTIFNLSTDCVGEYNSTPYNWSVYAPRQYSNPYYNFDNFGNSLFILFQIVSQEGWTDVMWTAMSSQGRGLQQKPFASQGNAVFFIIFNLLGAVFVLTLFVSVFMRNYTEQTGVAFLTADQRSWLELRKLLRQISPSKRPSDKPDQLWRTWCYRIAVKKHGKWQKTMTTVLCLHLVLLVLEWYPEVPWWEITRDYLFLGFTGFYIANIAIRILGLTWKRFRRSSWDLYSIIAVPGALITTILALTNDQNATYAMVHKLFLVSIALLLIPRNNQLDQLFKTAAASLTTIGNLLATWFVLFLVFAIALTQTFGLTRFGTNENSNLNFRNVPKALILLFRMSCGESWNAIMEDFATITPPNCVLDHNFYKSDCGSAAWARALFIAWNIVSMYIFVSMFVSLIFESFSYVYQRSSFSISRHEIRRFKEAWATLDREGTGFISKNDFPGLLRELSGVFDMRIYKGEHSVGSILEACRVETRGPDSPGRVVHGVDLDKLSDRISSINVAKIRKQRRQLDLFYQEVLVSADQDRGINFTSCLMILAHYNVISDSKSLRLEEFLRRRARLQRVEEEVRRRVVRGFFDMCYWSREFRRNLDLRHSARMVAVPSFPVPEIYVDDQNVQTPATETFPTVAPGLSPMDGPARNSDVGAAGSSSSSSGGGGGGGGAGGLANYPGLRHGADSRGSSPARSDRSNNASPRLGPHHHRPSVSDAGGYDGSISPVDGGSLGGGGGRSRAGSSAVDRQNALEVFDQSAWGESIRRSFTLSRRGTRGRSGE